MQGSRLPTRNQWVKNLNLRFIEDGHSYLFRKSWKYCFLFSIMNPKFSFSVPLTGNSTLSVIFPYIFCIKHLYVLSSGILMLCFVFVRSIWLRIWRRIRLWRNNALNYVKNWIFKRQQGSHFKPRKYNLIITPIYSDY